MSEIVINLLKKAIEDARTNLVTLEAELARQQRALHQAMNARGGRPLRRKSRGFREGSVPHIAQTLLLDGPLEAEVLAERISKKTEDTNFNARALGIALSKYIRQEKFFERLEDGRYGLKK